MLFARLHAASGSVSCLCSESYPYRWCGNTQRDQFLMFVRSSVRGWAGTAWVIQFCDAGYLSGLNADEYARVFRA